MLIEIAEKEEEDESALLNENKNEQNKCDNKNQSEINFSKNKKIIFNNYKRIDTDSKHNDIINSFGVNNNKNYHNNEMNIFNNYVANSSTRFNTFNNNINRNKGSRNIKSSFNNFIKQSNINSFHLFNQNESKNSGVINYRDKILRDRINLDNNSTVSLPNLNLAAGKEKLKNLSKNKNKMNYYPKEDEKEIQSLKRTNYEEIKENNGNSNYDNIKVKLISTITKSNNILIPFISATPKQMNAINKNFFINKDIKKLNGFSNKLEENNKNNINEFSGNNGKNSSVKSNKKIRYYLGNNNGENNSKSELKMDSSFMSKLHKIKIEKGMTGNNILEHLNNNILYNKTNFLMNSDNNLIRKKLPAISKSYDRNNFSKKIM